MSNSARRTRCPKPARNQPSDWSPADESWLQDLMQEWDAWPDYDHRLELDRVDDWRKESSNILLDDFE